MTVWATVQSMEQYTVFCCDASEIIRFSLVQVINLVNYHMIGLQNHINLIRRGEITIQAVRLSADVTNCIFKTICSLFTAK